MVEYVKSTGEADYSDEVMRKIEESVQEKEKGGKSAASAPQDEDAGEADELLPRRGGRGAGDWDRPPSPCCSGG